MNEPIVKETKKKSKFGNLPGPGPGRPKGARNQYTQFAYDLFHVWNEVDGASKLKDFIEKNDRNFGKFLEVMSRLMPKELKLTGELDSEITLKTDYNGMSYDELCRLFDTKAKASRCLLVGSESGRN